MASSFADWKKDHRLDGQAPRQLVPMPVCEGFDGSDQPLVGTSSFGMSGVNAHIMFQATVDSTATGSPADAVTMFKQHLWALAPAYHMLSVATVARPLSSQSVRCAFLIDTAKPTLAFLQDHQVAGHTILPATAMFDAFISAFSTLRQIDAGLGAVADVTISEPLQLQPFKQPGSAVLECMVRLASSEITLQSRKISQIFSHCSGRFAYVQETSSPPDNNYSTPLNGKSTGLRWSSGAPQDGPRRCTAVLSLPHWSTRTAFTLHPSVSDACLHVLGAFFGSPRPLEVPVAADALVALELQSMGPRNTTKHASAGPVPQGRYLARDQSAFVLTGLQVKKLPRTVQQLDDSKAVESIDYLYDTTWQAFSVAIAAQETTVPDLIWSATKSPSSAAVAQALGDLQEALRSRMTKNIAVAIHETDNVAVQPCGRASQASASTAAALAVITKSAAMEFTGVKVESTQIPALEPASDNSSHFYGDAFGTSLEAGALWRPRFVRAPLPAVPTNARVLPDPRGSLASLKLKQHSKKGPAPGEVQLAVRAVGLNFRDVLNVLGMYPGDPGDPGADCSGVVMTCGTGVTTIMPGDAVFGLAPGCLGPCVYAPAALLVPKPESLDFAAAASTPTVFITALAALQDVTPHSTVLIHASSGGVGLAAQAVARSFDCQVIATAGAAAKRSHVREDSGVLHIENSRHFMFVDAFLSTGCLPNFVLNSLTSPGMVAATLSLLPTGARFVEIGKRDIWSATRFAQERPDVQTTTVAIDFFPPRVLNRLMTRLAGLLAVGKVTPPQTDVYRLGAVADAFRKYSQVQHIGKLVLTATAPSGVPREAATTVITGGLGDLGLLTLGWLIGQGERYFKLLSRSGRGDGLEKLQSCRAHVTSTRCDTASLEEIAACFWTVPGTMYHEMPPVRGIINSAGVLEDATFLRQTSAGLRKVFAPKLHSTLALMAGTTAQPISLWMLFSSAASLFGAPGQANYAAANAALEGLAEAWSGTGVNSIAIQWGAWAAGMALDPLVVQRAKRTGLGLLSPEKGLDGLHAMLGCVARRPIMAAVPIAWPTLLGNNNSGMIPHFFIEFWHDHKPVREKLEYANGDGRQVEAPTRHHTVNVEAVVLEVARRVVGADVDMNQPLMQAGLDSLASVELRNALNSTLGIDLPITTIFDYPTPSALATMITATLTTARTSSLESNALQGSGASEVVQAQVMSAVHTVLGRTIDPDEPLMQAGLDSLGAVELRNALNTTFGIDFPATIVMDFPTVASLVGHITGSTRQVQAPTILSSATHGLRTASESMPGKHMPILLSSSSSVVPSSSHGSLDTVSVIPPQRWDWDVFSKSNVAPNVWEPRFGSFVTHAEFFDVAAFAVSGPEAVYMDPQQRLLMERSGELIAGSSTLHAASHRCAIMVGIGTVDYVGMTGLLPLGIYYATGGANSVAAGRVSYVFDLKGPSLSIDTACSSSLVAAHYSVVDMRTRAVDAALAAGVNLTLSPRKAAAFSITGMLSADGRCKTLDAAADGYVRAETCVVHLLEMPTAEGSHYHSAVILGSAVNQDGRSSSLTAPNGPAQQVTLRWALEAAHLADGAVGGIEMHGTGTALGDPIEIGAALKIYSGQQPLALTGAKSRMGHAETGAGALGMLSGALQQKHLMLMPLSHLRAMNPYVSNILDRHPGLVLSVRQNGPRPGSQLPLGVSSFAFQVITVCLSFYSY